LIHLTAGIINMREILKFATSVLMFLIEILFLNIIKTIIQFLIGSMNNDKRFYCPYDTQSDPF
jgi:hypothetical protein